MLSLSKLLVLSTAGVAAAETVSGLSPTATLDAGVVVGTTTAFDSSSTTVNKFLGVPFAAPPKRFELAGNPEPWTQPLDTKIASAACVQQFRCTFPPFPCYRPFLIFSLYSTYLSRQERWRHD